MRNTEIDHGKVFDWGRASADYAKYRDIYPQEFYQKILDLGLCQAGQKVLDLGTGTGVLPRNLYQYGADFTGIDISENQIGQAKKLAEEGRMNIQFQCIPAEKAGFSDGAFDVVTACQCFFYFKHEIYEEYFTIGEQTMFDVSVPFTRESWNGRIRACRGIGASLTTEETECFDQEHRDLLNRIVPPEFEVLHYAAMAVLHKK